jgi:hypothetical protein
LKEERDCVKESLDICTKASKQASQERSNVFEDISMVDDNYQYFVSTVGDLVSARRITIGSRSLSVFGQMSDDSVQQISRGHAPTKIERTMEPLAGTGPEFENRYGAGFKLSSRNQKDLGATPK